MISRTRNQRMMYESWVKYRMDEAARLQQIEQARQDGYREGLLLGQIEYYKEFLGLEPLTEEESSTYDEQQLSQLAAQLLQQVRDRKIST